MDKETVIKGLENLKETIRTATQYTFTSGNICAMNMARIDNAITLLKEQKAIKPIYDEEKYGDHLPHCGNCEKVLPNNAIYGKVNFCHYCGQAVKLDG